MYDYIIITHIPAFYKVNLYNELAKKLNIFVIFLSSDTVQKRSSDFISYKKANFKYKILYDGDFQDRNVLKNIIILTKFLKNISYKQILVSGWDLLEFWYLVFLNKKDKNILALESTIYESATNGTKGFIKKIFLSRIKSVFASGKLHEKLLKALKFNGDIKITKGVGIINKPSFKLENKKYEKRFLFIGRLSSEKNIKELVKIFNSLPECFLTVIGIGELIQEFQKNSNANINFVGMVQNSKLKDYFLKNDIFILPSVSETWGLVVEEALYFGLPVLVSEKCGVSELVKDGINGYIIDANNITNLNEVIAKIDSNTYKKLVNGVKEFCIDSKDLEQIKAYCI